MSRKNWKICDIDNSKQIESAFIQYDTVKKSYERIMKFKDEIKDMNWNLYVRVLRSFVPISINIVNEKLDDKAELIAEYNMPFVEKRLLLQLHKKQNTNYYSELYKVFDKIWEQSIEVQ